MSLLPPPDIFTRSSHRDDGVQRCDARHPCASCSRDGDFDCVYEQRRVGQRGRGKLPAAAQPFLFSFKSRPSPWDSSSSSAVPVNGDNLSLLTPDTASLDADNPVFSSADPSLSNASTTCSPLSGSDTLDKLQPPACQEGPIPGVDPAPFPGQSPVAFQPPTISTFSVLLPPRFPFIPLQLHTPPSVSGPEHFQVSDVTSSELDLTLCVSPPF